MNNDSIEKVIRQKKPDIYELPAYNRKWITTAQQEKIDYILESAAKNRQGKIDQLGGVKILMQKASFSAKTL